MASDNDRLIRHCGQTVVDSVPVIQPPQWAAPSSDLGVNHVASASGARPAMEIGPSEELLAEPSVPDLLSGADVELIFARSARTLHRWEQRGHLTPVRVGHAKFYRAEDIRRLVGGQLEAAMRTQAGAPTGTGQRARTGKSGGNKMP